MGDIHGSSPWPGHMSAMTANPEGGAQLNNYEVSGNTGEMK